MGETAAAEVVGRERELSELRRGLADAVAGRGRLFMVGGEPGIGKTTLAEALTEGARDEALAVWGRCWENAGAPAYWPWVQALRAYFRARPDADPAVSGPYLARLVPEIAAAPRNGNGNGNGSAESEQARFALFDAVASFLRSASVREPLVLVLDDLHAADRSSLLMLQFVARELRDARLLVIGTYREVEARHAAEAGELIAAIAREGAALPLRGLGEAAVARVVEGRTGVVPSRELAASLHAATEGNPFFVDEVVRLLQAEGSLELAGAPGRMRIPDGVRETITRRIDALPAGARASLAPAAVIGREFSLPLLERVFGTPAAELLETLTAAESAGLVARDAAAPGRYRFGHALVRETLYEALGEARRVELHRLTGEAIENLRAADLEPHLAELAHHFVQAASSGQATKAVEYAARAGERANRLLAHEDAAAHYASALAALDAAPTDDLERRCDLLLALGKAEWRAAETARAKQTFFRAGEAAGALRSPARLARAALGFGGRFAWIEATGTVDMPLVALLETALAAQPEGDDPLKAQVMARLSMQLYFSSTEMPRRDALSAEAIAMARRLGDDHALAYALNARRFVLWHSSRTYERLRVATELVEVAERAGEPELAMRGHAWRIIDLVERGELPPAAVEAEAHRRLAEELRQPLFLSETIKWKALFALQEGRLEDAERATMEFASVAERAHDPDIEQAFGINIFVLRTIQGRLEEIEPGIRAFVEQYPAIVSWRCALAWANTELGREDEARVEFDRLAAGGFFLEEQAGSWAIGVALLAEVCFRLDDVERAGALHQMLLPYERLCVVIGYGAASFGAAARSLGLLETVMGRYDDAEHHFRRAAELNERMGARPWIAWTLIAHASMLLRRARPGDAEQARELLARAVAVAESIGSPFLLRKAREAGWSGALEADVTLLFSDIVGSTAATHELGDRRWLELLRDHNATIRAIVRDHGGVEVKTRGDGFMVAFALPQRAVESAVAMQHAFAGSRLRVRIGIHTGVALRDEDDFYGTDVNMAARVADQAGAGEILVSEQVRELVAGAVADRLGEPRPVELKGLPGEHLLHPVLP